MSIISFYRNEKKLVRAAKEGDPKAQKYIYDRWAPMMLSVCRRYIWDIHFAEDVMIEGFVQVFKKLDTYREEGSFEGWIRKIMVRKSIAFVKKQQFVVYDEDQVHDKNIIVSQETLEHLNAAEIQEAIDQMPEGYKMVFLMYVVEGYKHKEIAEILGINEGTSKSQLAKAKKMMQAKLKLVYPERVNS